MRHACPVRWCFRSGETLFISDNYVSLKLRFTLNHQYYWTGRLKNTARLAFSLPKKFHRLFIDISWLEGMFELEFFKLKLFFGGEELFRSDLFVFRFV